MNKLLGIILLSAFMVGCSGSTSAPTHRWASTDYASKAQYHADHQRCQASSEVATSDGQLDTTSPAFAAYKKCMNSSGYVLTAYNDK